MRVCPSWLLLVVALATMSQAADQNPVAMAAAPAGATLTWKCLWPFGLPCRTDKDAVKAVDVTRQLGFNVIVLEDFSRAEFRDRVFAYARQQGVQVYLLLNPVYGEWGFPKAEGVTLPAIDCLQFYWNLAELNTPKTPDDVAYPGPWLCPDRPEVRQYAADMATALCRLKPDGIALDFVGYKNQSACQCNYSRSQRATFAKGHGALDTKAAERQYSLESLIALYSQVRAAVLKTDPQVKLAAHVYPPFDSELYGNRLPVENPGQTVAWFFAPHWPMQQVRDRCRAIKADEKAYHPFVTGTGFIGLCTDPANAKSPARLREEIQTVRQAGLTAIMMAGGFDDFQKDGPANVLAEQLGLSGNVVAQKER